MEDYQWYKQHFAQRRLFPKKNVNFPQLQHFGIEGIFTRMGWLPMITILEPVFTTLVRAFYSRANYDIGDLIISIVQGVEIRLDLEGICCIFNIAPVGLRVYEFKMWPTVLGFEFREAIKRICELLNAQGMGKPSAHSLMVISRVLHHMLCSIFFTMGWKPR